MNQNVAILIFAVLIFLYDVYIAIRSGGRSILAWALAGVMFIVILLTIRLLSRRPNA